LTKAIFSLAHAIIQDFRQGFFSDFDLYQAVEQQVPELVDRGLSLRRECPFVVMWRRPHNASFRWA
jgi:hypothetical protein